jgi:hypothetical protein
MSYLIYSNAIDAKARNHEEATRRMWSTWMPQNDRDTPYWWSMITHPDTGEVALNVGDAENVQESEADQLVETLDQTWTPEVENV